MDILAEVHEPEMEYIAEEESSTIVLEESKFYRIGLPHAANHIWFRRRRL